MSGGKMANTEKEKKKQPTLPAAETPFHALSAGSQSTCHGEGETGKKRGLI